MSRFGKVLFGTARRWWLAAALLVVLSATLASFAAAIAGTIGAGEEQFRAQQRIVARQLADRVGETLRRVQVAAETLELDSLPGYAASTSSLTVFGRRLGLRSPRR